MSKKLWGTPFHKHANAETITNYLNSVNAPSSAHHFKNIFKCFPWRGKQDLFFLTGYEYRDRKLIELLYLEEKFFMYFYAFITCKFYFRSFPANWPLSLFLLAIRMAAFVFFLHWILSFLIFLPCRLCYLVVLNPRL